MHNHTIIDVDALSPRVRVANHHQFLDGQTWLNRVNPDPQLILCLDGSLVYEPTEGDRIHSDVGSLLFVEPGLSHSLYAQKRGCLSGIHLEFAEGSWASRDYILAQPPAVLTALDDSSFRRLSQLFCELDSAFAAPSRWREQRLRLLATYILMLCADQWRESGQSPRQSQRARKILRFVRDQLTAANLSRARIAQEFGMTPGHLNHVFRRDFGCTPVELIHRERCRQAHQLLTEQDYSVKEAGYAVGFSSPAYFSRIYKKVFALAPKQARKAALRG